MKINWSLLWKIVVMGLLLAALASCTVKAVAMDTPVRGGEYLESIGADDATRVELLRLWREWEQ